MKWISKTDAIRRADQYAINELKVPGILLMEAPARKVCKKLKSLCSKDDDILFLCGSGGNGGDGFAAARMMKSAGYQVRVFFAGDKDRMSEDARINYDMLAGYQISVLSIAQASVFNHLASESEWVVDALFGTGLDREIQGLNEQPGGELLCCLALLQKLLELFLVELGRFRLRVFDCFADCVTLHILSFASAGPAGPADPDPSGRRP